MVGWIKNFGTILTNCQKARTIDQNERAAVPAQAANMVASYSNVLAQWPATAP